MPRVEVPLSIIVATIGFISSLIASIREDVWHDLWQRFALTWPNGITIIKTIIFFHAFVNFEMLNP